LKKNPKNRLPLTLREDLPRACSARRPTPSWKKHSKRGKEVANRS